MKFLNRHGSNFTLSALLLLLACPLLGQEGTWTSKAPMPTPRGKLAVGVVDGILYAVGGVDPGIADIGYSTVEAYNRTTNSWTIKSPLPIPCWDGAASAIGNILYFVGCGGTFAYDPKTDTWAPKAPMPTPRGEMLVAVAGGILYAIGGEKIAYFNETYDVVEAYDPKSNSWTTKSPMPTARCCMAGGVIDGLIYVAGGSRAVGYSGRENYSTIEVYDPQVGTWATRVPIPTVQPGRISGILNGKLYAIEALSYPAFVYEPSSNSWETIPPDPEKRYRASAGVVDDTLYVVGGLFPYDQPLAVNEAFDPFLRITIDIKPDDPDNTINLKSRGTVPVAILGSATFDPLTVDPATVTLAGAPVATRGRGVPMTSIADVNADGYLDLLLHFRTQSLQLTSASTEAVLYGETFSGQRIRGADSVRIVAHGRLLGFGSLTEGPRAHAARAPN